MEIEITKDLGLTSRERSLIDMHSFLNIITILIGNLQLIALEIDDFEIINPSLEQCEKIRNSLSSIQDTLINIEHIDEIEKNILDNLNKISEIYPQILESQFLQNSIDNVKSIFINFKIRVHEILARVKYPEKWEFFEIDVLNNNFLTVFSAIERNSKGGYRIIFPPSEHTTNDYFVCLNFKGFNSNKIFMPPVFQDVMRDLLANSRKYTNPGGVINSSLEDDGKFITFVVKDNGCGIPDEEITNVIDFGFRGSNVRDKKTNGGGFGLTKSYFVTKQFNGRMWINSELNKGTKITIKIPRPEE